MHFIFILNSENGGHLENMASILDFQVAHRADLTSSPQRTFVPNLVLVSQFARLVPLSAPLILFHIFLWKSVCSSLFQSLVSSFEH